LLLSQYERDLSVPIPVVDDRGHRGRSYICKGGYVNTSMVGLGPRGGEHRYNNHPRRVRSPGVNPATASCFRLPKNPFGGFLFSAMFRSDADVYRLRCVLSGSITDAVYDAWPAVRPERSWWHSSLPLVLPFCEPLIFGDYGNSGKCWEIYGNLLPGNSKNSILSMFRRLRHEI
jgi:hypothetical protein